MKLFVLSGHAARDELLASTPSDALRGVADRRRRLSRNIHKEAKIGQTPADTISGSRYNHLSSQFPPPTPHLKHLPVYKLKHSQDFARHWEYEYIFKHCSIKVPWRLKHTMAVKQEQIWGDVRQWTHHWGYLLLAGVFCLGCHGRWLR